MTQTPRRFRRRLLVVMLTLGLLPLLGWGVISHLLTTPLLAIRTAPLEALLGQVDERLLATSEAGDAALRREVEEARTNLLQAELVRRSLSRLLPRLLVVTLAFSAVLLALAAVLMGRQLADPIEQLADGMARYARGDLGFRLSLADQRLDELQLLVRQFNRMGDELAAQRARLEVSEAIAAWQGVARALAHELKNPLTAMRMAMARLARRASVTGDAEGESLALVERQIDALLRLAQSFSEFARLPSPRLGRTEARPVIEDVCVLYRQTSAVPIECEAEAVTLESADAGLLGRALGNLVKNAVEASAGAGEPVRVTAFAREGMLQIEVVNGGCGVATVLAGVALARSLGTTKVEGSGLGLPIAHRILHEHGGSLRLEPRPGGGTLAIARVPISSQG